jgi:hypothetical protein
MVTSEQTSKHLSWYIGIVVAKLPFGLEFFVFCFFSLDKFSPLGDQKKSGANTLKENELWYLEILPKN